MSNIENRASNSDADAAASATSDGQIGEERSKMDLATAAIKSAGKGVWAGAAVGIGSAAIVAALLYSRKKG